MSCSESLIGATAAKNACPARHGSSFPYRSACSILRSSFEFRVSSFELGFIERARYIFRSCAVANDFDRAFAKGNDEGLLYFPVKKVVRSRSRVFVLHEIEYKVIKLPVNREPRQPLFFSASNLGASRRAKSWPHYKVIKTHY